MNSNDRAQLCRNRIDKIASSFEDRFRDDQVQLSFGEYLDLFSSDPGKFGRDAGTYLRDMFDHYGTTDIDGVWETERRWKLFDLPWEDDDIASRHRLVGQEQVQAGVYRELSNFARAGRPNRLMLLHGPNGSSKSTLVSCIMRGLEDYSRQSAGALYRFHWVFPNEKRLKGAIGFGTRSKDGGLSSDAGSFAHLSDDELDARLFIEVRDHPLFVIPVPERRRMLLELWEKAELAGAPPAWLMSGQLAHKNQQIVDALLSRYKGSLAHVLRHVFIERFFISRRYRVGAVTIGPQMSVDAGERQVTADQNLASLPVALQSVPMFEAFGELVDASGGMLEFSDLLKRPLDTFKYLQQSVETGEVALRRQNLQLNCVMVGSANDIHLEAFQNIAEFPSYRGRMSFIRTPYLLSYRQEQQIYDSQVVPQVQRHVAPHATEALALFAVLTRMVPPDKEFFRDEALGELISGVSAVEKADMYSLGKLPDRLSPDEKAKLKANLRTVAEDGRERGAYEGKLGASPREMLTTLLDASQSPKYACLSPLAVLDQLDVLCRQVSQYEWLNRAPDGTNGYFDTKLFRREVRRRLLDDWEAEVRESSGLVDERQYAQTFRRYVEHVSAWSKNERIHNRATDSYEKPDELLMDEVEQWLGWKDSPDENRRRLLSKLAAWAIEHPDDSLDSEALFADDMQRLRDSVYEKLRKPLAELARDVVRLVRDDGSGLSDERRKEVRGVLDRMAQRFGYCDQCAADATATLMTERFRELVEA